MSRRHVVFATKEQIDDLIIHCKAGIKMANDGSPFFAKLLPSLEGFLEELESKRKEIHGPDRK